MERAVIFFVGLGIVFFSAIAGMKREKHSDNKSHTKIAAPAMIGSPGSFQASAGQAAVHLISGLSQDSVKIQDN